MQYESKTLGELLDDPRISLIASDAIKNRDLRKEDTWNKTLLQLKEDGIRGDIALGLDRLYAAAETGDWYYPLYSEIEIAEDESRRRVNLVRFSSNISDADPLLCTAERNAVLQRLGAGSWKIFGAHGMMKEYCLSIEQG